MRRAGAPLRAPTSLGMPLAVFDAMIELTTLARVPMTMPPLPACVAVLKAIVLL